MTKHKHTKAKAPVRSEPKATWGRSAGLVGRQVVAKTRSGTVQGILQKCGGHPHGDGNALGGTIETEDGAIVVIFDDELLAAPVAAFKLAAQTRTTRSTRSTRATPQMITLPSGADAATIAAALGMDPAGFAAFAARIAGNAGVPVATTEATDEAIEAPDGTAIVVPDTEDEDEAIVPVVDTPEIVEIVEPDALEHANAVVESAVASAESGVILLPCEECGGDVALTEWPAEGEPVKCADCQKFEDDKVRAAEIRQRAATSSKRSPKVAPAPAPVSVVRPFSKEAQLGKGKGASKSTRQKVNVA